MALKNFGNKDLFPDGLPFQPLVDSAKDAEKRTKSLREENEKLLAVQKEIIELGKTIDSGDAAKKRNKAILETGKLLEKNLKIREKQAKLSQAVLAAEEKQKQAILKTSIAEEKLAKAKIQSAKETVRLKTIEEARAKKATAGQRKVNEQLKKEAGLLGSIQVRIKALQKERLFAKTNKEVTELNQKIRKLKNEFSQLSTKGVKDTNTFSRAIESFAFKFNLLANAVTLAGVAISRGISQGLRSILNNNIEISDSIADVRKTTQLTEDQVQSLIETFKDLDTRTGLDQLLEIAKIGGQLGVARKDIDEFVVSIDRAVVALGDEFPGGAEEISTALGKINAVFKVSEDFGVGEGLTKIGSAINALGQAGLATSPAITDFTKRLGQIAPSANIAVEDILGLAAASEGLGQRTEVASTALTQIIGKLATDTKGFAEIAGLGIQEFSELVNTDANEALLQFFEGLNRTGVSTIVLANELEGLGLQGTRVAGTVLGLAKNVDLVREKQALASEEFEKGTSLLEEFEIKNNNVAASVDKLNKELVSLTESQAFRKFLQESVESLIQFLRFLRLNSDTIIRFVKFLTAVTAGIISFKIAVALSNKQAKIAIFLTRSWSTITGILTGKIRLATIAQKLFNIAVKSNPIAILIGLVVAAVTAIGLYSKSVVKATGDQSDFNTQIKKSFDIFGSLTKGFGKLFDQIKDDGLEAIEIIQLFTDVTLRNVANLKEEVKGFTLRDLIQSQIELTRIIEDRSSNLKSLGDSEAGKLVQTGLNAQKSLLIDINNLIKLRREATKGQAGLSKAELKLLEKLAKLRKELNRLIVDETIKGIDDEERRLKEAEKVRFQRFEEDNRLKFAALNDSAAVNRLIEAETIVHNNNLAKIQATAAEKRKIAREKEAAEAKVAREKAFDEADRQLLLEENKEKLQLRDEILLEMTTREEAQEELLQQEIDFLEKRIQLRIASGLRELEAQEDLVALELELAQKRLDILEDEEAAKRKARKETFDELKAATLEAQQLFSDLNQARIAQLDEDISGAQATRAQLVEQAAQGNLDAQTSILAIDKEIEDKQAEKERRLKRELVIRAGIATLQLLGRGLSSSEASGEVRGSLEEVKGVVEGFHEGNRPKGKNRIIMVNDQGKGEEHITKASSVTKYDNLYGPQFLDQINAGTFNPLNYVRDYPTMINHVVDDAPMRLEKKLDDVVNAIKNQPVPSLDGMSEITQGIQTSVKQANKLTRKHHMKPSRLTGN